MTNAPQHHHHHYTQLDPENSNLIVGQANFTLWPDGSGYEPPAEKITGSKLENGIKDALAAEQQRVMFDQEDYLEDLTAERDRLVEENKRQAAEISDLKGRMSAVFDALTESEIAQINFIYQRSRGVGHTRAMINGAGRDTVVVAASGAHAQYLTRLFQTARPLTDQPEIVTLDNLDRLMGYRKPVVIDNFTITQVFARLARKLADAGQGHHG